LRISERAARKAIFSYGDFPACVYRRSKRIDEIPRPTPADFYRCGLRSSGKKRTHMDMQGY
jgi:hypothetical protein